METITGAPEPTDADLIVASLSDAELFSEVVSRHHRSVAAFVRRQVRPDDALDLVSEVFMRAFDRRSTYDVSYPAARPWLMGIAANVVRQHHRKEGRRRNAMSRASRRDAPTADIADSAVARADAAATRLRLAEAIRALRPVEAHVLLLFALGDMSYEEIALALHIPVGTVRSRLSRARSKLRNSMGDTGE